MISETQITLTFVVMVMMVGAVSSAPAVELCSTCAECEEKLSSGLYETVQLDADILDHPGTCISLDQAESNVVFDCAGHLIDGDGLWVNPVRGIALMHGTGNTVKNCTITDFSSAIYLVETTDVWVLDNVLQSNNIGVDLSNASDNFINGNTISGSVSGIKLSNSGDNLLESNRVCDNYPWDIYFASGLDNEGYENTCNVTYYWNDFGSMDCTYTCAEVFNSGFEDGGFGDWSVVTN